MRDRDGRLARVIGVFPRYIAEAAEEGDAVLVHSFDLTEVAQLRDNWFVFRDRRPDLYGPLTSLEGPRDG